MSYRIDIKSSAERDLARLPKAMRVRIDRLILELGENPRPHGVAKLVGYSKLYRMRAGDYRVIYAVDDEVLVVLVVHVAHRLEVYRRM